MTLIFTPRCLRSVFAFILCVCGSLAYGQENPTPAQIAEWRKAAELGNAEAQCNLGFCYVEGRGVTKNEAEGLKWHRMAAEQGHARAQLNLGIAYANALGVTKNEAEAVVWYRKAAEQGYAPAQFNLGASYSFGRGVKKNAAEAFKWYKKSAERGTPEAQYNLGTAYSNGFGVTKNEAEAVVWYRKAAEQGYAAAQFRLGVRYYNGLGTPQDYVQATQYYLSAAEQGYAEAQCNLSAAYQLGLGVPQDYVMSYMWSNLAVAAGVERAQVVRDGAISMLTQEQIAEGQRLSREWKPRLVRPLIIDRNESNTPSSHLPKITGTGFLITRNGYLVTNHHVVKDCGKVRVQTSAGLLDAVIVRVDAASDLALLKVTGNFDALPIASSRTARLGATVATVGFPNIGLQGFEPKLSKGEISSLAGIQDDVRYFQISVPIQPGNSGGPLVDERGNVVGVVTAQLNQGVALQSTGTLAQSVNYAVKSSYLLSFLEAIPEASSAMLDANNEEKKFESVVDDVKKATVLIIGY